METSSTVKFYLLKANILEEGSQEVKKAVEEAEYVTTAIVTYAETRAALAMARRQMRLPNDEEYRRLVQALNEDWPRYTPIPLSDGIVRLAGDLAEKHALRGYDAVQLASALDLVNSTPATVGFSSWDNDLVIAARREGLRIV